MSPIIARKQQSSAPESICQLQTLFCGYYIYAPSGPMPIEHSHNRCETKKTNKQHKKNTSCNCFLLTSGWSLFQLKTVGCPLAKPKVQIEPVTAHILEATVEATGPWWRPLGHGGGHWAMVEATGP